MTKMTPLLAALVESSIDLDRFSQLGQTTCLGTKTYLSYDGNKGWSIVQLNIIQRIFRYIFGRHYHTSLNHIYCAVSSERLRNTLDSSSKDKIEKLRDYFMTKWVAHHTWFQVPTDWRIIFYPIYAKTWNAISPDSFPLSTRN